MLGNTLGRLFRVTTCGEAYGEALQAAVAGNNTPLTDLAGLHEASKGETQFPTTDPLDMGQVVLLRDGRNVLSRWRRASRFRSRVRRVVADAWRVATDSEDARARLGERVRDTHKPRSPNNQWELVPDA